MLEEFENEALFLRLGLPSTLIRHENGAFRKRSSNWRNLKTPALRLRVDGKHFENGASRKRWRHDNHVISLTEFSWNTSKSEMTGHRCIFKFLWRSVDGKTWCVFRVKSPFSNSSGVVWTAPKCFNPGVLTRRVSNKNILMAVTCKDWHTRNETSRQNVISRTLPVSGNTVTISYDFKQFVFPRLVIRHNCKWRRSYLS